MVLRDLIGGLGCAVASIGSHAFAAKMCDLLAHAISFDLMEISEWIVDQATASIVAVHNLGGHGLNGKTCDLLDGLRGGSPPDKAVERKVIELVETQVILGSVNWGQARAKNPAAGAPVDLYQCSLACRRGNRRYVISLYRVATSPASSFCGMSFLNDYSNLLLRIVEKHATCVTARVDTEHHGGRPVDAQGDDGSQISILRQVFTERVQCSGVTLSLREREVCLALLMGHTVGEVASKLSVRPSTVETYTKRAAVKLGVSGRHGLIRWMTGVSNSAA